ncbi:hypothetical protein VNO77_25463 [Canavalia gladiata]|uniref:Polygalacturonase n=1 Tax=Canavalia gladiata TaxID=3824 RepID=A0AAN9L8P8_CANGL
MARPPLCLLILQILLHLCWLVSPNSAKSSTYNVIHFGAKPNGLTDSTMAFLSAWNKACGSPKPARIYVPRGRFLLAKAVTFNGECANKAISITINGTLLAPSDYRFLGNAEYWLTFDRVTGLSILGGVLDARGTSLWSCKLSAKSNCPVGATTLVFRRSKHIMMTGLTSLNSQMFHIAIIGCHNVKMHRVKVIARGDSPNTDGIHVQFSTHITIIKPTIRTGDDCISIGPASKNLWIQDVSCGPGHGISIGSLGWDLNEPGVKNVTVRKATFFRTQNGFRIKSWGRPSSGFVNDVHFEHATMIDVQNPIVIDQHYCPNPNHCPNQPSGVKISDVSYKDIHGTSATRVAVKFECSPEHTCKGITMEDLKLTYKNQVPQALCKHVVGTALGIVQPKSCL